MSTTQTGTDASSVTDTSREAIEQAGGKHYRKCLSIIRESGIDVENLYGVGYRLSDKDRRDITSIINDEPEFRR